MTRIGLESKDRPVEMNSINRCTADTCWQITSGSNGSKPATESLFKTHKTNNLCIARVVAT